MSDIESERQKLLNEILKRAESLLVVSGGRPFLQANHFGGLARLARRISHFLRHGSIHTEKVMKFIIT